MKTFNPKPWTAGAPITWQHFYPDGSEIKRSGIIWDRAPSVGGASVVAWVIPHERLTSDIYSVIAVAKASKSRTKVHGNYWSEITHPSVNKDEAFSSNFGASPTGSLGCAAYQHAYKVRSSRVVPVG